MARSDGGGASGARAPAAAPGPSTRDDERFEVLIEGGRGAYLADVWQFRGLLFFLAWRDVLVRYKQAVIGVVWAAARPLLTMVAFSLVFGALARLPAGGAPYPVLVFSALLPWQLFAGALQDSSESLIANAPMISKVYFPRILLPASAVAVSLVDFLMSMGALALVMGWYRYSPSWRILSLPLFTMLAVATALGAGLWCSALSARYRDFRYVVPFVIQCGLFVSPVGFSSAVVPERWRWLYALNPLVGVIEGFRWALLRSGSAADPVALTLGAVVSAVLLVTGFAYFRRAERVLADVI